MAKINHLTLRVSDPEAQRKFYCDVLGMKYLGNGQVGYGGLEAALCFLPARHPYSPQANDIYWKIALAVPDIDLATAQLREKGVAVSTPSQFQDVGHLAKFTDPEGFTIELIDHWFEGNRPAGLADVTQLGGGAHLNLITLRTHDARQIHEECTGCGMVPLSVQPVDAYGFTLYFYAFTEETPPVAELTSVDNREWLYQRPYTVLEVQHVHALTRTIVQNASEAGYVGTYLAGVSGMGSTKNSLRLHQIKT